MRDRYDDVRPGQRQLSAQAINDLQDSVESLSRTSFGPSMLGSTDIRGNNFSPMPTGFWAQITGADSSQKPPPHAWKTVLEQSDGSFADMPDAMIGTVNGVNGATQTSLPAYDPNGGTIATNTVVWLVPGRGGEYYEAQAGSSSVASVDCDHITDGTISITGSVVRIQIDIQGSGYTSAPKVVFNGSAARSAQAQAFISGGQVTSLLLQNGGEGYTTTPTISFTGGGGSGAAASATLGGDQYIGAGTKTFDALALGQQPNSTDRNPVKTTDTVITAPQEASSSWMIIDSRKTFSANGGNGSAVVVYGTTATPNQTGFVAVSGAASPGQLNPAIVIGDLWCDNFSTPKSDFVPTSSIYVYNLNPNTGTPGLPPMAFGASATPPPDNYRFNQFSWASVLLLGPTYVCGGGLYVPNQGGTGWVKGIDANYTVGSGDVLHFKSGLLVHIN